MIEYLAKVSDQISTASSETGSPSNIEGGVGAILSAALGLIAIVAVIVVIIGGISIATSQGDPGKIKKGRTSIIYGLIGMAVALLAFAIVQIVLTNLSGS